MLIDFEKYNNINLILDKNDEEDDISNNENDNTNNIATTALSDKGKIILTISINLDHIQGVYFK